MKTTAAVLVQTGQPLVLAELEIPLLKRGQVLVEVAYSGVCHTQLLECRGYRGDDPYLPHCLGHEGSGTVLEIGDGVTRCKRGDRVILSWMKGAGADVPGCVYDWAGRPVNAGGVTTFMRHSVVSENRVTPLPAETGSGERGARSGERGARSGEWGVSSSEFRALSLRDAALLGCAVPTGIGAVWNTAALGSGQSIAVFGTGGIGLCSVAAAAMAGAARVIAVDVNPQRRRAAERMGATHTIDATTADPVEQIKTLCPGGLDFAIEASGQPVVMRQALSAVRSRGGTVVVVGNARHGESLQIDPRELNQGKRLLGTWGGDNEPDRDFPRYCELVIHGKLDLEPLRDKSYRLDQINTALDDLEAGRAIRPLVDCGLGIADCGLKSENPQHEP